MRTAQKMVSSGSGGIRFGRSARTPTVTEDNFALHRALVRRERKARHKWEARMRRRQRVESIRDGMGNLMRAAARPVVRVLAWSRREPVEEPVAGRLEEVSAR